MSQPAKCPQCGATLPADSPEGLCRACLFKRGLESNTVGYTQEPSTPWTPPAIEELAAHFPELELHRLIGRGGMGAVYQARQKSLDRTVALKILPPAMASEAAFAERFAREAQAMAKLNHPHIVTIYEFGHLEARPSSPTLGARASSPALSASVQAPAASPDLYYFLMEYVDGLNLRGLLDSGHVSPKEALAIVPQICEALQYAHDQGIVHRDIKPENILLNRQGQVKIADFGLAKLMGVSGESRKQKTESRNQDTNVTLADSVMGTPAYMAPEQTDRPSEVDHRADIYSLGVVFYQMLTGELPKGAFEPPSRKVQIDVRLDEIVMRALEKEPGRRYQQASEVKTQVETIAAEPATAARLSYATRNTSQDEPRFSRTAIVGACWSVFAILWVASPKGGSPTKLSYFFDLTIVPLGVSALLGTTILGWIAVSQIRHSAGRLYGLGLAVFDGLLFPLLASMGLIAWFWSWVFWDLLYPHQVDGLSLGSPSVQVSWVEDIVLRHATALVVLSTFVTAGIVCAMVVRFAWRAVRRPLAASQDGGPGQQDQPRAGGEPSVGDGWMGHLMYLRNGERRINWRALTLSSAITLALLHFSTIASGIGGGWMMLLPIGGLVLGTIIAVWRSYHLSDKQLSRPVQPFSGWAVIAIVLLLTGLSSASSYFQRRSMELVEAENRVLQELAAETPVRSPYPKLPDRAGANDARWRGELLSLNGQGWREAFGVATQIAELPPDEGLEVLASNWKEITSVEARQQILKAFAFKGHRQLVDVLNLGMHDPAPPVQSWAVGYLRPIALQDFAADFAAYEPWYAAARGQPVADVFRASLDAWFDRPVSPEGLTMLVDSFQGKRSMLAHVTPPQMQRLREMLADLLRRTTGETKKAAMQVATTLPLDRKWQADVILPMLREGSPEDQMLAVQAVAKPGNDEVIEDILKAVRKGIESKDPRFRLPSGYGSALGEIGSAKAIPGVVDLIAADNSYATVYGLGYFALWPLTGVEYDASHDGAWWKQWWAQNRGRFETPSHTPARPIPLQSPTTQPATQSVASTKPAAANSLPQLPRLPAPQDLPGALLFHGRYQHRSGGRDIAEPSELWVNRAPDGSIAAMAKLPPMQTVELVSGDQQNRPVSYRIRRIGRAPEYGIDLQFTPGQAMLSRRGIRQDVDQAPLMVPANASFDPNSRPDSYLAANVLLRQFASLKVDEIREIDVFDWDNTGEKLVDYKIRVQFAGVEKVQVPAGAFEARHLTLTQTSSADTWFKKRQGHTTDFWLLENGVILRILRHREPYEMLLLDYDIPTSLPGLLPPSTAAPSQPTTQSAETKR